MAEPRLRHFCYPRYCTTWNRNEGTSFVDIRVTRGLSYYHNRRSRESPGWGSSREFVLYIGDTLSLCSA